MPDYVIGAGNHRDVGGSYLVVQPPLTAELAESMERMTGGAVYQEDYRSVVVYRHGLLEERELLRRGAAVLRAAECVVEVYTDMPCDEAERQRASAQKSHSFGPVEHGRALAGLIDSGSPSGVEVPPGR